MKIIRCILWAWKRPSFLLSGTIITINTPILTCHYGVRNKAKTNEKSLFNLHYHQHQTQVVSCLTFRKREADHITFGFMHYAFFNMWDLKLPAHLEAKSHWLHFVLSQCVFLYVFLKSLEPSMHNHIGCTCLTSPQSEFSNVSSNCFHKQMHNRIGCICTTSTQNEFSNVSSNWLPG